VIPPGFIQDLLSRVDIVELVGRHVELKRSGSSWTGLCPFHAEKSPSFNVVPAKQFYHCFGCGASGDAIRFLTEHQGLSFVEAVRDLAQQTGLTVPEEQVSDDERVRRQKLRERRLSIGEVLEKAAGFYREQLKASPRAIEYLKGRGLTGRVAARFGLGWAPPGWHALAGVFPRYDDPLLEEAGLVRRKDEAEDERYDWFRERVMFPIRAVSGEVVGFGGRVLDDSKPKYMNSPETPVFSKGRELYGLFEARQAVRDKGFALVVEGYMDVVALAQLGFPNAVATLGTACTADHVHKLLRFTEQVVFSFDGDAAGRRAAGRALEAALPHASDTRSFRFLFLPPEHDPDSYIREHGKEAFEHLIGEEALPLSGYLLRELAAQVDLKTPEGRSALVKNAQPLLSAVSAPTLALLLRKEVAALAGMTQPELEAQYDIKPLGQPVRRAPQKVRRGAFSSSRLLLCCLLYRPELARELPADWGGEGDDAATVSAVAEFIRDQGAALSTQIITQQFMGTAHEAMLKSAGAEITQWGEDYDVGADFHGILEQQRKEQRKQQLQDLLAKAGGSVQALSGQERELYLKLLRD
jgi:DNA primase